MNELYWWHLDNDNKKDFLQFISRHSSTECLSVGCSQNVERIHILSYTVRCDHNTNPHFWTWYSHQDNHNTFLLVVEASKTSSLPSRNQQEAYYQEPDTSLLQLHIYESAAESWKVVVVHNMPFHPFEGSVPNLVAYRLQNSSEYTPCSF